MTIKEKKEELIKEFEFKFYGQVNCVDDTGGYDAKPYLKAFLLSSLDRLEETVRNETVEGLKEIIMEEVTEYEWDLIIKHSEEIAELKAGGNK